MNTPTLKILDVGQCGFDGPRMTRLFESKLHAQVDSADTRAEALAAVGRTRYDVVLVNRVLASDESSGLDVIDALAARDDAPPVMLVSDRADAQEQAVARGALRGFGKAQLEDPATLEQIRSAARGTSA